MNIIKQSEEKNMKKKKLEIKIEIDLETKFFKVVDFNYKGDGGAISGDYKDKQNFLAMFNDYCEEYICFDLEDNRSKLQYE